MADFRRRAGERFIEFSAGVGHAAHKPDAALTADAVVTFVAIDLVTDSVLVEPLNGLKDAQSPRLSSR